MKKIIFCYLVTSVICMCCRYHLPPHEKIIRTEQLGLWYEITYIDTTGRSMQLFADTIVNHFQRAFVHNDNVYIKQMQTLEIRIRAMNEAKAKELVLCDTLAGMLESYGIQNYSIAIQGVKKSKGKNFKGEEWQ